MKRITEAEFNQFKPSRLPQAMHLLEEQEWYAGDGGNVVGALTLDKTDQDWGFVIQGRDGPGRLRSVDFANSIQNRNTARVRLLCTLGELERSGQSVFSQGNQRTPFVDL